jgi:integrase
MLDPILLAALREHWRAHHLPGPWLFPAPRGASGWHDRPITLGAASQAFRRTLCRSDLRRRVTLHSLRHAFATHLHEDGVGLNTLRVLLGHRRIETASSGVDLTG